MAEKHTDPVCSMEVTEEDAVCSVEFKGKTYFFCDEACREQFAQNPDQYLTRQ